MTSGSQSSEESLAISGYVVGFFFPAIGPLIFLILNRSRGRFVRIHIVSSVAISTMWLTLALLIVSAGKGHVSINEQGLTGMSVAILVTLAVVVVAMVLLNVQRVKRHCLPVGWRRERSNDPNLG